MYIPEAFAQNDPIRIRQLLDDYGFATLITLHEGLPFVSHLPLLFEPQGGGKGRLIGHLARENPQCADLTEGAQVLAVFQGPHGYVSPSWYEGPGVPTWNYAVAHVHGQVRRVEAPQALLDLLERLTQYYESGLESPWTPDYAGERLEALASRIMGFEIEIARIEGKFKLSQNRSQADRLAVIGALSAREDAAAKRLAAWMMLQEQALAGDSGKG